MPAGTDGARDAKAETESERLVASAAPAPPAAGSAETCGCGKAATAIAQNNANVYLKEEGATSAAARHFNKPADAGRKQGGGCCVQ